MARLMVKALVDGLLRRAGLERIKRNTLPELTYSNDTAFHELYDRAKARTGTPAIDDRLRRQRHYTLNRLLSNALLDRGDVCELGCWRGLSAYQIASHLQSAQTVAAFHIFDSFAGLPKQREADDPPAALKDTLPASAGVEVSLQAVRENLKEFPFIQYHPGWIPDRFHEVESRSFSFVHVDVVLYRPIRDSFLFFYPRLVAGGIMVFDDYGYARFGGARRALDECRKAIGDPFFLPLPSGQAFLIRDPSRERVG